jgi:hypothetical protein
MSEREGVNEREETVGDDEAVELVGELLALAQRWVGPRVGHPLTPGCERLAGRPSDARVGREAGLPSATDRDEFSNKRCDAGGHRTGDNPYMSRSTIQVLSKRDPRIGPIAGVLQRPSDGDLKAFTGWSLLTQMPLGGRALRDRPVTPRRRL